MKYSKEWLSKEEFEQIISYPEIKSRDLLLIKICYYGALRINEALISRLEDFKYEDDYAFLILRSQKTDKKNWEKQPIPLKIYSEIKRFCEDNKIRTQDNVFQSRQNKSLSYPRAYQIIKECSRKAGINKEITTHTLRRSRLQHQLDDGDEPFFVKEFARHKSIDTTRKYIKISKKKLFDKMNEIDKKELYKKINYGRE